MTEPQPRKKKRKDRCCLTQEGLACLKAKLARLEDEYQSDSGLAEYVGLDRGSTKKIRDRSGAVKFSSLQRLFSALDLDLEDDHWDEWQERTDHPPRRVSSTRTTDPRQPPLEHIQEVTNLLWTLNCGEQDAEYRRVVDVAPRSQVFMVRATDRNIQKWLVKRFTRDYRTARNYFFDVRSHGMRRNFDDFWNDFAEQLKISSASPEEVMSRLCQLAQTESIIIAVYGVHGLEEIQKQLLQCFWVPLSQRFCSQLAQSVRSRIFLFMTAEVTENPPPVACSDLCVLPGLAEITVDHVRAWIGRDDVYETLSQIIGEENINRKILPEIARCNSQPAQMIDELCCVFRLGGIDAISPYWELRAG